MVFHFMGLVCDNAMELDLEKVAHQGLIDVTQHPLCPIEYELWWKGPNNLLVAYEPGVEPQLGVSR